MVTVNVSRENDLIELLAKSEIGNGAPFQIDLFVESYLTNHLIDDSVNTTHLMQHFQALVNVNQNFTIRLILEPRFFLAKNLDFLHDFFTNLSKINLQYKVKEILFAENYTTFQTAKEMLVILYEFLNKGDYSKYFDINISEQLKKDLLQTNLDLAYRYRQIQNILKINKISLQSLEKCFTEIVELKFDLNCYSQRVLDDKVSDRVRVNDQHHIDEINIKIIQQKQQFAEALKILQDQKNVYSYYYLVKSLEEDQDSADLDYKLIFEYLEKLTLPLEADPNKDQHMDLYCKANMQKACLCFDKQQYAQIKGLTMEEYNDQQFESERMKLVIRYALAAQSEEGDSLARNALEEYVFGSFRDSTNESFIEMVEILFNDRTTGFRGDLSDKEWKLIEFYKKVANEKFLKNATCEQATQTYDNMLIFSDLNRLHVHTQTEIQNDQDDLKKVAEDSKVPVENYGLALTP